MNKLIDGVMIMFLGLIKVFWFIFQMEIGNLLLGNLWGSPYANPRVC